MPSAFMISALAIICVAIWMNASPMFLNIWLNAC